MKKTECEYELHKDVKDLSSVRISSFARVLAYPDSEEKFVRLIDSLDENNIPFFVIGRMSNVLIKDRLYNGVLISTSKIKGKNVADNRVVLSCGESLPSIVRSMAELDLGGFEGLFGIPGSIGGMVRQNAGAFGYEISDRFINATCYLRSTSSLVTLSKDDMHFSYRDSILSSKDAILINATFDFVFKKRNDVLQEINKYSEIRRNTQPVEYPSLGSVFKRCGNIGAGYYIDKAGLKGNSIGGAKVSEKHAGFIINTGSATADEYLKLIEYVKERIYAAFGIELKEEIEII